MDHVAKVYDRGIAGRLYEQSPGVRPSPQLRACASRVESEIVGLSGGGVGFGTWVSLVVVGWLEWAAGPVSGLRSVVAGRLSWLCGLRVCVGVVRYGVFITARREGCYCRVS